MVCGMAAASEVDTRGARATIIRLRADAFDQRTESMGATSETAKAELVNTDRKTLWRYRQGRAIPGLDLAMQWAERLDLSVEELWEQVA